MSKRQETDGIRFSQVLAGALAAVTAALIGSTMGVAGTVVGAGLASVISTVGGTLYLRSIQRTKESVRTVRAKVVGRSGGTTVLVSAEDPSDDPAEKPAEPGDEVEAEPGTSTDDRPPAEKRRLRWAVLAVTTLAAFALGMVAVTGVEWLRGESLSGDGSTTFGSIVAPHHDSGTTEDPTDSTTSTTTPSPASTTTTDPTTSTAPTTTSTTPPSDSSTTTGTTTPPVTTTTTDVPEAGTIPPSN
jgi:hypothetical protein